jgi:hypothetical protein
VAHVWRGEGAWEGDDAIHDTLSQLRLREVFRRPKDLLRGAAAHL